MKFRDLQIIEPIQKALKDQGYDQPTPIQEQSIPILLDGKDLLGCAQTGTGKTAAFAIPILQHLSDSHEPDNQRRTIKSLVITPTRELAIQIADSFTTYGQYTDIKNTVIYGGVKQQKQVKRLKAGVDILVATPGRLLDLMNQGFVSLKDVEYFVLDEADQMLDMGFIHDIKKVIARLPKKRQSLFFSATMPPAIVNLSKSILGNPERVTITPEKATAEKVEQHLFYVSNGNKIKLLINLLQTDLITSSIVFSRTKHGANKIVKQLLNAEISAEAIHGNKSQPARQRALENFKDGTTRILVATDIAARGIDVDDVSHVINYHLPNIPETYVHRIGRTGRANASGIALSFCAVDERPFLRDIEKLINQRIEVISEHPYPDDSEEPAKPVSKGSNRSRSKTNNKNRDSRNNNRRSSSKSRSRNKR
ncbi:MAG: DEAD/DEAH box helicase [Balneola sp.]|nr:DEAD/DEAH box helicase [Balneola sp.]MBO6651843.1 DEAD/DEAH box helicase [Balneola sp.]MBO6710745.1 DEAD/DEAH box helicase [Balneola sp.]MBO6799432.1 DEAD/DEAH box helicase [Balneola sp.]MBO6869440.1 DEAD/DEAH box helicase [Balneola sp.]